ncbi:MAG TPA: DNA mismatch repair protein MutS, partial [Gammaproteobacteria bacterium]|nr:DNA mismatch repair protein MutS [Gammaproteobacteria bacterium]
DNIVNVHLDAVEHDHGIVFLHAVKSGPANQSYGLQVAQLAGIPKTVIEAARIKLSALETEAPLESSAAAEATATEPIQNELFAGVSHPVVDFLECFNPDEITAKEAL